MIQKPFSNEKKNIYFTFIFFFEEGFSLACFSCFYSKLVLEYKHSGQCACLARCYLIKKTVGYAVMIIYDQLSSCAPSPFCLCHLVHLSATVFRTGQRSHNYVYKVQANDATKSEMHVAQKCISPSPFSHGGE